METVGTIGGTLMRKYVLRRKVQSRRRADSIPIGTARTGHINNNGKPIFHLLRIGNERKPIR